MEPKGDPGLLGFLPIIFMSIGFGVAAYFLAKDKGRNVALWTILGLIPGVNFVALWLFIGASNLRMERKLDELLSRLQPKP